MKVGLLTLPFNNNYGGYLQAYALMTILKSLNCDVELINRRPNRMPLVSFCKKVVKNCIKLCIGRKQPFIIPNQERDYMIKGMNMLPFVRKHIQPISSALFSSRAMNKYIKGRFDLIVVGSDQVWRPEYVPNIEDFFLCGVDSCVNKVAYAASFGCFDPVYSKKERAICGNAIKKFKAVGLREKSGSVVMKKMGWNCECKHVLDPTMLLSKADYESLFSKERSFDKNELFVYILDDNESIERLVDEICDKSGLKKNYIIDPELWKKTNYLMPSVEKWLRGIDDSKMVITDSFHGVVFSIIFNKPFWVVANENRGSDRFESLLSLLHLEKRMITTKSNLATIWNDDINWENVNQIIDENKDECRSFIAQNVKCGDIKF